MRAVEYNMRDIGRGQPELEKAVRLFQIHLLRVIKLPIVITGKTPANAVISKASLKPMVKTLPVWETQLLEVK